ncbi:MAG: hypothetical protein ACR2K5_15885 [Pseudolabrys sp.]
MDMQTTGRLTALLTAVVVLYVLHYGYGLALYIAIGAGIAAYLIIRAVFVFWAARSKSAAPDT